MTDKLVELKDIIPIVLSHADPEDRWELSQVCRVWKKMLLDMSMDGVEGCRTGDLLAVISDIPHYYYINVAIRCHRNRIFRYLYRYYGVQYGFISEMIRIALYHNNLYVIRFYKIILTNSHITGMICSGNVRQFDEFCARTFSFSDSITANDYYTACYTPCIDVIINYSDLLTVDSMIELHKNGLHFIASEIGGPFSARLEVCRAAVIYGYDSPFVHLHAHLPQMQEAYVLRGDVAALKKFEATFNCDVVIIGSTMYKLCYSGMYEMIKYLVDVRGINVDWDELIGSDVIYETDAVVAKFIYEKHKFPLQFVNYSPPDLILWMLSEPECDVGAMLSGVANYSHEWVGRRVLKGLIPAHKKILETTEIFMNNSDDFHSSAKLFARWKNRESLKSSIV